MARGPLPEHSAPANHLPRHRPCEVERKSQQRQIALDFLAPRRLLHLGPQFRRQTAFSPGPTDSLSPFAAAVILDFWQPGARPADTFPGINAAGYTRSSLQGETTLGKHFEYHKFLDVTRARRPLRAGLACFTDEDKQLWKARLASLHALDFPLTWTPTASTLDAPGRIHRRQTKTSASKRMVQRTQR